MKLRGTHDFQATPDQIWDLLMDAEVLARITPGVDRLEETAPDTYDAIAEVKLGPVKGKFSGLVEVKDKQQNESFVLGIDQKSKIGNAKAEMLLTLKPTEEGTGTNLSFDGDVRMSGLLASTGQRVISGVVAMLSKQFFTALEEEIQKDTEA